MTSPTDQEGDLRQQIAYLEQALQAVARGGVDAVVLGDDGEEQVYALTSADRPYRVIVESMGDGAVTLSGSGVVLFANAQIAGFLGVERASIVGRDLADYVSQTEHEALLTLLENHDGGTRRAEVTLTRADGSAVPFLAAATDLDLDGVTVQCLVLTDVSLQKEVELQRAQQAAEDERRRVAREVNDTIVQGLVAAEMLLDLDHVEQARAVIARTSAEARRWIGELAGPLPLEPGMAIRARGVPGRTGSP